MPKQLTFLILALAASVPCNAQPRYVTVDLGTLGGPSSTAYGINRVGQAVGISGAFPGGFQKGFRTAPNARINPATDDIGTLGGPITAAFGINAAGQVAGQSYTAANASHAFRTAPNAPIVPSTDDIGILNGDSMGRAINESGQVTGCAAGTAGMYAFRTAPNAAINPVTDNLGSFGGDSCGQGINQPGQAVGYAYIGMNYRAFRTAPNAKINLATDDLGTLGGVNSNATAINDLGQAAGWAEVGGGIVHAFRTAPNAVIHPATDDLGTLGGDISVAYGINNSGQVVGMSLTVDRQPHAFLYTAGMMWDLNNLVPPGSGWILQQAYAINDAGQIVGDGLYQGAIRAFRLDPGIGIIVPNAQIFVPVGQSITLPVMLPSPAPPAGVQLSLASSNPSVLTVSSNVAISGGATMPDRRYAVLTGVSFGQAVITVSAPGYVSATVAVTVTVEMAFSPQSITVSLRDRQPRPAVTLSAPAPEGGIVVMLNSENPNVVAVPPAVYIPAGSLSVPVPLSAIGPGSTLVRARVTPFAADATLPVTVLP